MKEYAFKAKGVGIATKVSRVSRAFGEFVLMQFGKRVASFSQVSSAVVVCFDSFQLQTPSPALNPEP